MSQKASSTLRLSRFYFLALVILTGFMLVSYGLVQWQIQSLDDDAKIIWGAQIMEDLNKVIKTMVVVTGVKSDQIRGAKKVEERNKEIDDELGLEFIR